MNGTMHLPDCVKIVEVSPRDGLQNETTPIATAIKIELIDRLSAAGFPNIEAASFVSPTWVPQMADGAAVMAGIRRNPKTIYSALTPNMQGFDAARAANVQEVVIFGAASESFSQHNINCSVDESIARFGPVAEAALAAGLRLRGSISCALGCPYEGEIAPSTVAAVARQFQALGCHEIDVADTVGKGTPARVQAVMAAVTRQVDPSQVAAHFHDTYGQALANILAALQCGIRIVHSSIAGLGGCPYAPGAGGNVATEDVLYMLRGLDIDTGVDFDAAIATSLWTARVLSRPPSKIGQALAASQNLRDAY